MFSKHSQQDSKITEVEIEEALPAASSQETFHEPRLDYPHYEPILDPESEFPWHHPDAQIPDVKINVPEIDMTQFHNPWDIYRGHIPPNTEDLSVQHNVNSQKTENHEEIRKYAWDYISPEHHHSLISQPDVQTLWHHDNTQGSQFEQIKNSYHDNENNVWDYKPKYNYNQDQQSIENFCTPAQHYEQDLTNQYIEDKTHDYTVCAFDQSENSLKSHDHDYMYGHIEHSDQDLPTYFNHIPNNQKHTSSYEQISHNYELNFQKDIDPTNLLSFSPIYTQHHKVEHVYCVHLDHEKVQNKIDNNEIEICPKINGDLDYEIIENITPRHPYDGYYLRHRMTIDSRGRKICTHEVPPTPTPSPPESPIPLENCSPQSSKEYEIRKPSETEDQTGVAGNLARVVLGVGAQREALDDLTRRQGWEAGNIDYMGVDAFDNIWAKISQTLNQPRVSPPKQSTPPPQPVEISAPPAPVEITPPILEAPTTQTPTSMAAPDAAPTSVEASTLVDPPVPAEALVPLAEDSPVPVEAPVYTVASVTTNVLASLEVAKRPESPALNEAPAGSKILETVKTSELDSVKTTPIIAPVPAAAPEPAKIVAAVVPKAEPKPAAPAEAPIVESLTATAPAVAEKSPAIIPSESPEVKKLAEAAAPVAPPKVVTSPVAAVTPTKPDVLKSKVTPEKVAATTDSPPLANTPSKEEVPIVPAAKSEERRKPAEKLQLHPPAAADPLPTPDSELEDAATLAHAIISSESRTPPVTSPSPPAAPASPRSPPAGAVSLAQIGVESQPKGKSTTAAQIESSVTEASADAPKKRVVKKVLKKEGAGGAEVPVPPPRKKEKKPKDK